ncbi:acetolactate decarboxylase [Cesiribacter andamanensis]
MHKGDLSSRIHLQELAGKKNLYALGAVAGLKGEILILNGQPFVSRIEDNKLHLSQDFSDSASLLVWAQVENWQQIPIPDSVRHYAQLEHFIAAAAKAQGIDLNSPFPFMLEGPPASARWHVINWPEGEQEHSHAKHKASGLQGVVEKQSLEFLGFYSNQHHGVFTHHSTNIHLHVKTSDNTVAAHLDELEAAPGMLLKLPR